MKAYVLHSALIFILIHFRCVHIMLIIGFFLVMDIGLGLFSYNHDINIPEYDRY